MLKYFFSCATANFKGLLKSEGSTSICFTLIAWHSFFKMSVGFSMFFFICHLWCHQLVRTSKDRSARVTECPVANVSGVCTVYWAWCWAGTWLISSTPLLSPMIQVLSLPLCYPWGYWSYERLSDWTRIIPLAELRLHPRQLDIRDDTFHNRLYQLP